MTQQVQENVSNSGERRSKKNISQTMWSDSELEMWEKNMEVPETQPDQENRNVNDIEDDFVMIGARKFPKLNWTRLKYDEHNHDNRCLLEHRVRDCQCETCFRALNKLPPPEPIRERIKARQQKLKDREIKRAKKIANKQIKAGKQASIRNFFRY